MTVGRMIVIRLTRPLVEWLFIGWHDRWSNACSWVDTVVGWMIVLRLTRPVVEWLFLVDMTVGQWLFLGWHERWTMIVLRLTQRWTLIGLMLTRTLVEWLFCDHLNYFPSSYGCLTPISTIINNILEVGFISEANRSTWNFNWWFEI